MKRLDLIGVRLADFNYNGHRPHEDIEWLLARVRQLEAALRFTEFAGDFCDEAACPVCLGRYFQGHSGECSIRLALKALSDDSEEARK